MITDPKRIAEILKKHGRLDASNIGELWTCIDAQTGEEIKEMTWYDSRIGRLERMLLDTNGKIYFDPAKNGPARVIEDRNVIVTSVGGLRFEK